MFTKFLLCFFLFGTVLFLDLVSLSSADEQKSFDEQKSIVDPNLIDLQKIIDEEKFLIEQKPIFDQKKIDIRKIIDDVKFLKATFDMAGMDVQKITVDPNLIEVLKKKDAKFFNEPKPIFDQKLIDVPKITDEEKFFNEPKPFFDQKLIDVPNITYEEKFFNEQKPIFDQKLIDEQMKIIDRLEIGCEEECLPPAECILDQCFYDNVSNFNIPDVEIDNPESRPTLIHYAHTAHLIKALYVLVVAIIALVSYCCRLTRRCCSKSNEIPYEQDVLLTVESPQPPADGFQQPLPHDVMYMVYQPTDTTYSVNSSQPDLPPSYDNVVKSNADASTMNC